MYDYYDLDDSYISLHDCRAERMTFDKGILSFVFPDGFWVTKQHPKNKSNNTVCTTSSQVDFRMINGHIDGLEISVFREYEDGKILREDWEPEKFINTVNTGVFQVEFITQYKSYQSFLFKCWIWFDDAPYHSECEIIINCENAVYTWNHLRYDCVWQ